jgi:hypothetical protein
MALMMSQKLLNKSGGITARNPAPKKGSKTIFNHFRMIGRDKKNEVV